jgi:signal peptidase I
MKTCAQCGFHHADAETRCIRCGALLGDIGEIDPLIDPKKDPARHLRSVRKTNPITNFLLRVRGAIRLFLYRLGRTLIDPLPADLPPYNPWKSGFLSLLLPGLGQLRNRQPRKALWFFLGWIGWLALSAATFFDPVSDGVLGLGVLFHAYAWHDAFLTTVRVNRHGDPIAWQRQIAYYLGWIFYIGFLVTAIVWLAYWPGFRRVHILHNELTPWIKEGESMLLDRFSYLWRSPRAGDIVYYNPPMITMELVGAIQSKYVFIDPVSMIERVVAEPGDVFEYHDDVFLRNGRPVPPGGGPLRDEELRPFRIEVPADRYLILFTYTGSGIDPLPIHQWDGGASTREFASVKLPLIRKIKLYRQESPDLTMAGAIVTNWEQACLIPASEIRGRPWLIYDPPPARRFLY